MSAEDNAFRELLDDYVVECLPLAERVADAALELERLARAGEPVGEVLAAARGALHTVKGNSAMMGLAPMQELAHALEDLTLRQDPAAAALLAEGTGLLVEQVRAAATGGDARRTTAFVARVRALDAAGPDPASAPERRRGDRRTGDGAANVVRVDFRRLDTLLEVLGEGLIEHSAIVEAFRRLGRRAGAAEVLADLDRSIAALEKTMKRLESVVMDIRLLPISTVFGRFPRLVREIAQGEKKPVRLAVTGGETALDKAVLDRLGEPLLHLISNAVVHGIEPAEERRRAGKPEEAVVELSATSQSGRVIIRLADDGRGLDEAKIIAKAEAMGIEVGRGDRAQVRSLIFLPGFSTADRLSHVAGRGVGLDVVAGAIHGLGGTIEVDTRPGEGTAFTLDLPLTLAIVRSLIVEVDQERYAVPMSLVAETVRAEPAAIHEINRKGVTLWRGDLIHVSDGGALLGTGLAGAPARRFFLVLSAGGKRRGVLVDRLVGHQDVVVKGLDPSLGHPEVVSGTTILGDGRIACILDPMRILDQRVPA